MANVGTTTVKILPDLSEFKSILDAIPPSGLVVTKATYYTYTPEGMVASTVETTQVTKA